MRLGLLSQQIERRDSVAVGDGLVASRAAGQWN